MRFFYFISIVSLTISAKDYKFTPNRRNYENGGANRNEWSSLEYGFIQGILKYSINAEHDEGVMACLEGSDQLFSAWAHFAYTWIVNKLNSGESDKQIEEEIVDEAGQEIEDIDDSDKE